MPINTTERTTDLAQADTLLQKVLPQIELEIFDNPTVEALQKAMKLYEKWEAKEKMAEVYEYLGATVGLEEAVVYYKKSLDIRLDLYGELHETVTKTYGLLGMVYLNLQDFDQSKMYLDKSLEINLQLFEQPHLSIATAYGNQGSLFFYRFNFDKAIDWFLKAIDIFKKLNVFNVLLGEMYYNISSCYSSLDDHIKASYYLKESMALYQKLLPPTHKKFMNVYYGYSNYYLDLEDFDKALRFLQKANNILLSSNADQFERVYIYTQFSAVYSIQKNYQKVIENSKKVLVLLEQYSQMNHSLVIYNYLHLGTAYTSLKKKQEGLIYLEKALHQAQNLFKTPNSLLAIIYVALGKNYYLSSRFEKGLECLEQAIKIYVTIGGRFRNLASAWSQKGSLFYRKKQYSTALSSYHKALMYILEQPPETDIYSNPSFFISKYEIQGEQAPLLNALLEKGETLYTYYQHETKALKDLEASLQNYQAALDLGDTVRQSFQSDDSKLLVAQKVQYGILDLMGVVYTFFELTGEENYLHQAFGFVEKSKAYLMLQTSQDKTAKQQSRLPKELLQQEI